MRTIKLLAVITLILTLGMVWAGCAKPPEAEKEAAKQAMEAALSAGAEKYSLADMDAARKAWDTAESQMKEKKYNEAKQAYIDAKAAFEKAAAGVEAGKKAVAEQANTAMKLIQEDWKKLRVTASKMGKKLKEKKQDWAADTKAINEGLIKAKEMIASAPAEAKAKLDELKALIEKWGAAFKQMATPTAKPKPAKKKK